MSNSQDLRGIVVALPSASLEDYVGVVEVLVQESLNRFIVPLATDALPALTSIFGSRAFFGASGVNSVDDVAKAVEAGAQWAISDLADAEIGRAAAAAGLPIFLSAMTPTEVRNVLIDEQVGAALYPADVMGHSMGVRLAEVGLIDRVLPIGGVGAYAAGEWLKAGAKAACVDSALIGDAFEGGALSKLRDRAGSFSTIDERYR